MLLGALVGCLGGSPGGIDGGTLYWFPVVSHAAVAV